MGAINELVGSFIQADQAALHKLMDIIAKFAQQALDEKAEAEQKLQEAIETYAQLKKQMQEEIVLNKKSRAKQQKNKKAYETEKAEKEDRKEALEKEKALNEKLQQSLKDTYEKEKKDRAEEISVVGTLIHIVQTRLIK